MNKMMKILTSGKWLVVSTILACGGQAAGVPRETISSDYSCDVLGYEVSGTSELWQFSDNAPKVNPDPAMCQDEGRGAFMCATGACLAFPYSGTCPHCGGGGE